MFVLVLSVNEIRERFGNLMAPIFLADEFHAKYAMLSDLPPEKASDICSENFDLAIAYIHSIATHMEADGFALKATRAVSPEVILTAYTTYWVITQVLIAHEQEEKVNVPDSDADFLLYMFRDFLGTLESSSVS